jgi:acyl-CoA synthetase (AMP-forming)/AMP-acid ligase II
MSASTSTEAQSHPLAGLVLDEHVGSPDDVLITMGPVAATRAQVREATLTIAAALHDLGIARGDTVASVLPTSPAAIATLFGIWAAGAVAVPVNPRLTDAEIVRLLEATNVVAVVAPPGAHERWGGPDDYGRLAVADRSAAGDGDGDGDGSVAAWHIDVAGVTAVPATGRPHHDDGAAIVLTTSGTTGAPKPVVLNDASVLDGIDTVLASLRGSGAKRDSPRPDARADAPPPNLLPVPLALWAGVYNTLFAFRAGAGVVLLDPFGTEAFAAAVRRHGIKSTVLAPAMIAMLTDDAAIDSLLPLRIVRSITAPLSPHQARRFHERFGVVVLNSYGQTELGGEVIGWRAADARAFGAEKLGAIGRPHAGIDVQILDGDQAVGAGQEGELCVRSPYMMQGYLSDEMNARLTADGFLRTGDIGHVDADGFVWLSGRVSDLIIRGGLKVFPADVEEVLLEHPAVRDVAVVGVPDDRLGEVPWAFIVLDQGDRGAASPGAPLEAELAEHARRHLAAYKVPVHFVVVDELPRNDVGKVLRRDLADRATASRTDT